MKLFLNIIRIIVGVLFIFSGLLKANDPLGLAYKMQEFFEAWHWAALNDYALLLSIVMNVFEVLAGVALLVGWQMRLFSWLLLLLIVFFTFLTSYVLFSDKIKNCGCFGDCLPLTPIQTFLKDIVLLLLIIILFLNVNKIQPLFTATTRFTIVAILLMFTAGLQSYVLEHLPIVDCLPYKKENNILDQMKLPVGALPDSFVITYQYKKDGKTIDFDVNHFPENFDSSFEYINRYDKLIRKGNATPKIVDFSLKTISGVDTTQAIFAQTQPYILFFAKDFPKGWNKKIESQVFDKIYAAKIPFYIVTASVDADKIYSNWFTVLLCDATVIKTAARVNPTYFFMKGATIIDKISYADKDAIEKQLQPLNSKP